MTLKRGLSLSFCVADIISGKVALDDVAEIVTSTAIRDEEDFEEVMRVYSMLYWRKDPVKAREIVHELWNEGLIVQPRLIDGSVNNIANGWWEDY